MTAPPAAGRAPGDRALIRRLPALVGHVALERRPPHLEPRGAVQRQRPAWPRARPSPSADRDPDAQGNSCGRVHARLDWDRRMDGRLARGGPAPLSERLPAKRQPSTRTAASPLADSAPPIKSLTLPSKSQPTSSTAQLGPTSIAPPEAALLRAKATPVSAACVPQPSLTAPPSPGRRRHSTPPLAVVGCHVIP